MSRVFGPLAIDQNFQMALLRKKIVFLSQRKRIYYNAMDFFVQENDQYIEMRELLQYMGRKIL